MLRALIGLQFTLLAAGSISSAQAQWSVETFRGTALNTAPIPGITGTTRGRDAFQIVATEEGLLAALGEHVTSKLGTKRLVLRVGAKLTDDLRPPCRNESMR